MTTGRFVTATLVGGIVLFFLGFLIWGLAFMGFFEAHAGSATGVAKDPPRFLLILVSQFVWAGLLTLVIGTWARVSGFGPAFRVAAVVGLLSSLSFDLMMYATTNLSDLTATLIDPLLGTVWTGIGGGVIGIVLARSAGARADAS